MDDLRGRLEELRNSDCWTRRQKIEEFVSLPEEGYLSILESWLRSGEDDLSRNIAMEVFRRLGRRATAFLVSLLQDEETDVRIFAANILGDIADPSASEALAAALSDRDENVRIAAAEAMGKTGIPEGVGPLGLLLADTQWVAMAALDAIGRIGGREAREVLHRFLQRGEYRSMTCAALERAGDGSSLEHLRPFLGRGEIGGLVLRAMVTIAEREGLAGESALSGGDLHVLSSHAGAADTGVRRAAIVAMGWDGDHAAAPLLIEALGDDQVQEDAIDSLIALGAGAAPHMFEALGRPGGQRGILAKLLAMCGQAEVFLRLADDADPEVRTEAALALGGFKGAASEEALMRLADDPVEEVRAAAGLALKNIAEGGQPRP